jgi:hypothetical protein
MNTAELDSYSLDDAVKFNKDLNPRLWHKQRMRPDVRAKLLEIAADFKQSLGLTDLEVKDITVSGSNAGFTYTPHSDIDLHLVVDIPQADISDVYRELFDAKKYQYNAEHNITIGGYDVELYVENANQPPVSQGVYSLVQDDWINIPKRRRSTIDDDAVRSKYADIKHRIQSALDSKDHDQISAMAAKIKKMRTAGLASSGEMGPENLAYKMLRAQGWIKKLYDAKTAARDLELSLNERKKKKKRVRYGYGGYWMPGFSFGDSEGGGDGGGGGESIREVSVTPDGVSPSTKMFLESDVESVVSKFFNKTADFLGIENLPKIVFHHDTAWSEQTGSFGQYNPDDNVLHLAMSGRHTLDILRTMAHELTHCKQNEQDRLPDNAGETGSWWEDEANAMAGRIMRYWADENPEMFGDVQLEEGIIKNAGAAVALAAAMAMTPAQAQQYLPQDQQQQVQQQGQLSTMQILNIARTIHSLKHNLTRAGAEEEINQEVKNYLRAQQGDAGAQNLSRLWQLQQRQQQKQQPQQQPWTGNQYQREDIAEASGYIPTAAEKNDPRYVMALSPDVRPGATGKNANKMALKTDAQGRPALLMKTANLREGRMPQPSQGPGKYRDLNEPLGPETPPTMPAGTVRIDVSDMYDWYKIGQHISNMKGLGKHDFGAGPPSSIISFGDEETEHKFIKDLRATGLDVTDIDPADPTQPASMRKIKTDPTYNVSEAFDQPYPIKWEKSEYGDYDALATLDDGTYLSISFEHVSPYEVAVSFWRNNSQEVTGEGDAQRVFATVLAAVQQFLKQEQPANISFSAVKEDDPSGSRSKLYSKLVQRYAANWGYQARSFEHDDKVEFELTKIRQNVDEDIVESLRREFALLEDEYISEVKMSTANLRQLAAQTGALAGMEFEMIVPNTETDVEPEYEPDYDQDQRARSFSDVRDFFHDGDYNSRRDADSLMEELAGEYEEWQQEQTAEAWERDGADYVRDYVSLNDLFDRDEAMAQARDEIMDANPDLPQESEEFTELLSARLNEMETEFADTAFEDRGRIHDQAFEAFAEEQREEYDERSFLDDKYPYMTDIQNNFDISWPYYYDINDGQDGEMDIDQVADDFSNSIGKPVNASRSYHGARREAGHYVVEPDGSLEGDNPGDGGLEFVSPPMPIDEMLSDLNKVKTWAKREGCYTNDSTGLHINISVPDYSLEKLDYVKLALLMGDEYVLDLFGRSGNTYAKAATDKIRTALKKNPDLAPVMMDKMRDHMEDLATKAIHSGTTEKYTSINTKTGYIEFRSPGGDWLDANFDKIENTLLRFTVALSAAIDPQAYRQEYLKKLYKLLESSQVKGGVDVVQLFSNYSAGELDKAALIRQVREKQLARDLDKGKIPPGQKYWWDVSRPGYFASVEVVASNKEEAIAKAVEPGNYPDWASARNTLQAKPLRPYKEPTPSLSYSVYDARAGYNRSSITASSQEDAVQKFRQFVSGENNPHDFSLVDRAGTVVARGGDPQPPTLNGRPSNPDGNYVIVDTADEQTPVYRYMAANSNDSLSVLRQWISANPGTQWNFKFDPSKIMGQPGAQQQSAAQPSAGNWGIWIVPSNRFARVPNTIVADNVLRRFPSREAAEQFLARTREENPQMRTDIEVREIEPAAGEFRSTDNVPREGQPRNLVPTGPGPWEIYRISDNSSVRPLDQTNRGGAEHEARTALGLRGEAPELYGVRTRQTTAQVPQTLTRPGQGQQTFTGEWQVVDPEGREIYRFSGVGNNQGDANRVAMDWLRRNPQRMQAGVEVLPVMG